MAELGQKAKFHGSAKIGPLVSFCCRSAELHQATESRCGLGPSSFVPSQFALHSARFLNGTQFNDKVPYRSGRHDPRHA